VVKSCFCEDFDNKPVESAPVKSLPICIGDLAFVKFNKDRVSQSTTAGVKSADKAIDETNSYTHTLLGVGQWWRAQFSEQYNFKKIRIRNRVDCPICGGRLNGVKVLISGKLCGTFPKNTLNGKWYEFECNLRGNEIKLVTTIRTYLHFSNIQAYAEDSRCVSKKIVPTQAMNYIPFQTNDNEQANESEETNKPVNNLKCTKSGIFGLPGKCYGGDSAKKWIANLKMPGNNDFIQDIWDDFIAPLILNIPTNVSPSGCLGDFSTNTLLSDQASKDAKCAMFPLPKDQNISAVGFSLINVPCPGPVKVQLCAIFDKCGTFGVSMSGGTIACFTAATGIGAILSPIASSAKYIQFGYSPNRMWESTLELLDPDNHMKKKKLNMKSHVYMGTQFSIPKTGIKFNGKDITELFALKIEGKSFLDFGEKNDFTPSNLKALIKDKSISADKKIITLLGAVREFSLMARGSFSLGLGKITKNVLPDIKLVDELDLNLLINFGTGPDGDKGSSGMQPGFHVFLKPPPLDIIGNFVQKIVNSLTKVLKIGNFPIPKFPAISGIEIGFTLGEKIGFKFAIRGFSIACVVKTKGGFGVSCKLGLDFLTILNDMGKWVARMGKKLFDEAGKAFMVVAGAIGDFVGDIAAGAKKFFTGLANAAKAAYEGAKKAVKWLHEKTKEAIRSIQRAHVHAANAIKKAKEDLDGSLVWINNKFNKALHDVNKEILNFINKIAKAIFAPGKLKKERKRAEEKKKLLESQKAAEENAKKAEKERKISEIERIEREEVDAANEEVDHCMKDENEAEQDKWRKSFAYERAVQRLNDL